LASIADWTSEIVVVLNHEVTDGTEQIAKSHGAKVIREPWKGMVGQKASAAAKATQEWILDLDADEVVSATLRDEIRRVLPDKSLNGPSQHSAIRGCPGMRAMGFATATGIPTGKPGCGVAVRHIGRAKTRTQLSSCKAGWPI